MARLVTVQVGRVGKGVVNPRGSVDPLLYEYKRKFGVAGGPDEIRLTEAGRARAFQVGAGIKLTPSQIEELTSIGAGFSSPDITSDISYLSRRRLILVDPGGRVTLSKSGEDAIRNFYLEEERLIERVGGQGNPRGRRLKLPGVEVRKMGNGWYAAFYEDVNIGNVMLSDDETYVISVTVEPPYRKKGVASEMYRFIERDLGRKLQKSPHMTPAGQGLWESRGNPGGVVGDKWSLAWEAHYNKYGTQEGAREYADKVAGKGNPRQLQSWMWAFPKGRLKTTKEKSGDTHQGWFYEQGWPDVGPEFDRTPRGRIFVDHGSEWMRVISYTHEAPNEVFLWMKRKLPKKVLDYEVEYAVLNPNGKATRRGVAGKGNPFLEELVSGVGTGTGLAISAALAGPLLVKRMKGAARELGLVKRNPSYKIGPFLDQPTAEYGDRDEAVDAAQHYANTYLIPQVVWSSKSMDLTERGEHRDIIRVYPKQRKRRKRGNPASKDPATMTPPQINKELDRLDVKSSEVTHALIDAGYGSLRMSEIRELDHPLARKDAEITNRQHALRAEIERRAGPRQHRMPTGRGFGPRVKRGTA